jgi:hypothetical protein
MIKALLQTTSLVFALSTGAAFANEARVLDGSPVAADPGSTYGTASVSFESMEMPDHGNGTIQFDLDGVGDVSPQVLGADVEGMGWTLGLAHDLASGWRIGGFVRGAEADGDASTTFNIPNGTPFRHGLLTGVQNNSGNYGGNATADQDLSVDYEALFGTLTYGRDFGGWRGDALLSFGSEETEYRNTQLDSFAELHITDTDFDVNAIELAGRIATSFPLSPSFNLHVAGSLGASFKSVEMDAHTSRFNITFSDLTVEDDDVAAVGALSGSLSWQFMPAVSLSLDAGWTFDSATPSYVAPNYVTTTPAAIGSEETTGYYAAVRLGSTW